MPTTTCNIDGKICRIDYEKTFITSGSLFHGTVFQDHIFEFFFVIFNNDDPTLFSPICTPDQKKNSIIQAIQELDTNNIKSPRAL
jgi:hypothetical protein